jgi:hypothetical protein
MTAHKTRLLIVVVQLLLALNLLPNCGRSVPSNYLATDLHARVCKNLPSVCRISGSHSVYYEELYLLRYNAMYEVESPPAFRRNMSPQPSGSKNN